MGSDLLIFILMLIGVAYWLDAIRSKEIASEAGKRLCVKYNLVFLDDTVVIRKVRLRRDSRGSMKIYREYQFEFTNNGAYRYKGYICMLGKIITRTDMETYREDGEQ